MNIKLKLTAWAALTCSPIIMANQVPTEVVNGNIDNRQTVVALSHATIHINPNKTIENATLLVQNGKVIGVSKNNDIPNNAHVKNYKGMHIYPGFIHLDADLGLPKPEPKPPFKWGDPETINSTVPGAYNSNEAIKASYSAGAHYTTDNKSNSTYRAAGFTTALSHRHDGIMRGTSVLSHVGDQAEALNIMNAQAAQHYSFNKGTSKQNYPISLMGSMALLRQTWLDAQWYQQQNQMTDMDLLAINQFNNLPKIISVEKWQESLLAHKLATEFDTEFIVKTSADSFKNLPAIKATKQTLIVPLSYPDAPAMHDSLDLWNVDLKDLKEWELAPYNPALLEQNDVVFALTPSSTKKGLSNFIKDLRKAHKHGLSEQTALAALTTVPANILGRTDLGTLATGNHANFIVSNGPIMNKDSQIAESWVAGISYTVKGMPLVDTGHYQITSDGQSHEFRLDLNQGKVSLKPINEDDEQEYKFSNQGNFAHITIKDGDDENKFFAVINDRELNSLDQDTWQITRTGDLEPITKDMIDEDELTMPTIPMPFSAYGLHEINQNDSVLIKNATVWTNEEEGTLTDTDVLVVNGQIKAVGDNLTSNSNVNEVDGTGMHLTSGIIDEHAHIALLAVNDVAVNSSMVRMQDVINPHDVNIYRNLAGGVTAAQLLHGSANPIGGQSALVKYKWGVENPADMIIDGADGFIKFALGENVKRSSNNQSIRYPQTRMGVEQVFRDAFTQAKAYEKKWAEYNKLSSRAKKKTTAPRKDLVMEATLEVVNQDRFVSCHSYVQSEINMLMHVAEEFNFNINTFTHILEGYKVADKMQKHGVGGSTFSDWWAYKWEVNYAIPYNAALMNNAGVVTAINSDSGEMSRRLNQEAAKSVKYGGLSEQDAWKLVTLNPAKLLHLDERMGSIKVGKDADLVLWSDNPLSIYAKAEKTIVDGVIYYDRSQQESIEQAIATEKARLVEMAKNTKGKKSAFKSKPEKVFECESITGYHSFDQQFFAGEQQ